MEGKFKMIEHYAFKFIFNREVADELKWRVAFSKWFIILYVWVVTLGFILLSIYRFWLQAYQIGLQMLLFATIAPILFIFRVNDWRNTVLKQYLERTGKEEIVTTLIFTDEMLKIEDRVTSGKKVLNYKDMAALIETKNHYVLKTKAGLFTGVNKSNFDNDQQAQAFLTFVRSKCVNVGHLHKRW